MTMILRHLKNIPIFGVRRLSSINTDKLQSYLSKIEENCSGLGRDRQNLLNEVKEQFSLRQDLLNYKQSVEEMKQENTNKEMSELIETDMQETIDKLELQDEQILNAILKLEDRENYQSVVLEVSAGVGGKEAMLFSGELYDMYCHYCEVVKLWQVEIIELDHSDLGGMRHASLCVSGKDVYRCLRHEGGVHRVQRIPVTEKSGRIHTSTVTVAIIPCPDEFSIKINKKDLREETKRASGAGGQHVNTTDSAVRITHLPSGIAVECQTDRSQIKNRALAMKKLEAKLFSIELEAQRSKTVSSRKLQVGQSLRNEKIRTYNYSQDRITDHRIDNGTIRNLHGFLQGGAVLDGFIKTVAEGLREKRRLELLQQLK